MKKAGINFYCFSPPVMVLTFSIEVILAAYVIFRYKLDVLGRLIAATLLMLGVFQLSEFNVCQNSAKAELFSRIGFVAITLLPPLGIHIVRALSGRLHRYIVGLAYATGFGFAAVFGLVGSSFDSFACSGNYAIFHLVPKLGGLYFAYYYFWLILAIYLCMYYAIKASVKVRQALTFQALGCLAFLLPTGIVNALNPETINGIPSVMCGFAVIYALVLSLGMAPLMLKIKR